MSTENEWERLFEGKTLSGWKQINGKAPYEVKEGVSTGTEDANSMIKDTGSINNLQPSILVVGESDEQTLGGESIWLNINISVGHVVDQR